MLKDIEEAILDLIVEDEELAFYYGISFGSKMGSIINEREQNGEIEIEYSTKKVTAPEFYNYVKGLAGYKTEKKVENYKNVLAVMDFTDDEAIQSLLSLFYDSKLNFEDIKDTKSDDYIKKYRRLLFMESEFIMEVSDSTAENFINFIRIEKQHNNYILFNSYFNGFKIGSRLMRDFDNIYKEIEKQDEKIKENISNS